MEFGVGLLVGVVWGGWGKFGISSGIEGFLAVIIGGFCCGCRGGGNLVILEEFGLGAGEILVVCCLVGCTVWDMRNFES